VQEEYTVQYDTSILDLYLSSLFCHETRRGHKKWNPLASSTAKSLVDRVSFENHHTAIKADLYNETVTLVDLTSQTLGAVCPSTFLHLASAHLTTLGHGSGPAISVRLPHGFVAWERLNI
jgi:hypothetical protein